MLRKLLQHFRISPSGRAESRRRPRCRPAPEVLEGRLVPAVLTVNTLGDETTTDNLLSLREAIAVVDAGSTAGLSGAEQAQVSGPLGSNDTIVFAPGLSGTLTLTQGALDITSPVTPSPARGPAAGPSAAATPAGSCWSARSGRRTPASSSPSAA